MNPQTKRTPQQIQNIKDWAVACMEPNAYKCTGRLTKIDKETHIERDCCLGKATKMFGREFSRREKYEDICMCNIIIYGDNYIACMPDRVSDTLGMNAFGSFTPQGAILAKQLTLSNIIWNDLSRINDATFEDDNTLYNVGKLILDLITIEETTGILMFELESPPKSVGTAHAEGVLPDADVKQ